MHGSARCLPLLAAVALVGLLCAPGCTRHDFRERADRDVEGAITQKNVFEKWQVKNWHAYPDPRARFADNSNPDRPPYPPDDYAARLLSPNPQKPTKKSGVGRVDGDGPIVMLERWNAENRAEDAATAAQAPPSALPEQKTEQAVAAPSSAPATFVPSGRGAGWVKPAPVAQSQAANAKSAQQKPPVQQWATGRPALPAPTLIAGDRPAVRHTIPPVDTIPQALRPVSGTYAPAAQAQSQPEPQPQQPVATPVAPASANEFGPWTAATPSIPGPVVTTGRDGTPAITELRPPMVIVTTGGDEPNTKPVPASGTAPIWSAPEGQPEKPAIQPEPPKPVEPPKVQPEKLPLPQPVPLPLPQPIPAPDPIGVDPKKSDPKTPVPVRPGDPVGKGGDLLPPLGDPAADYLKALETGQAGYRIRLEQAVELGVVNAREFQDRREDLYLAALPVTLERFNFAAQAFFTEQVIRTSTGRALPGGGEAWDINTNTGFTKRFPTGALLATKLANQVVIDLSGDKPTVTLSNLAVSLAQPFLRGGGRAVTLENLTLAERNLVYAMRSYARFRKLFFVAISAGPFSPLGYTNNPYGLQGLSANLGRGIGGNLTAPNVGYLPLLYQLALINNQQKNVAALERLLRLYEAFREGGQQSPLQVGQVELQLLGSRAALLGSPGGGASGIRGYLDGLDNFKLQLGLPITVPLELDDAPLRPIRRQLARYDELFAQARAVEVDGAKYDRNEAVAEFRKRWMKLFTTAPLVQGTNFAKEIGERWGSWAPDKLTDQQARDRLTKLYEERRKLLDARADRELRNQTAVKKEPEPPGEAARLARLSADIELGEFELRVREYEAQPWAKKMGKDRETTQSNAFTAAFNAFFIVVLEAQNERLERLNREWPKLLALPVGGIDVLEAPLDDAYAAAIRAALAHRLDLMNARAQVVDAWRQIAVTANSLQGFFDVRYDLNSSTPSDGSNPFAFSGDRSTHQLTFNASLPLVRRAERNAYRAALIGYQRQRRTLMAFEDNIVNDVRGDVRELRTFAQLYRIQQRVVELQYAQVDNATAILFAPPAPGAGTDAGSAAALTQQVLSAQSSLVNAQNNLYQIWVNYLSSRMSFYLDLEQMQLDDRGVWTDELFNRTDGQNRLPDRQPGERLPAPRPVGDPNR